MAKKNDTFTLTEVLMMMLLSAFFGVVVGLLVSHTRIMLFDKSDKHIDEIVSTYNNIVNTYYGKVNKEELVNGAIDGMVNSLDDPYSSYMNKDISKLFNDNINGYYEGLGIVVVQEDDKFVVSDVFKDSPASKVGVKKDDIIIKVNGKSLDNYTLSKLIRLMKKKKVVKLVVKRDGKEKKFTVKKDRVEVPSVTKKIIDKDIGYIKIETFASNTGKQFEDELIKLEKKNIKSLIIDLRNNPGGHLNQTDSILDMFITRKKVLYQVKSKGKTTKVYSKTKEGRKYPVIILMNEGSASASEIVISCMKENYKNIKLVGTMTYGKGTIQKEVNLKNGTSLKYTTEKWLTSKGKWLDHKKGGIKPDIEVKEAEEGDKQLDRAIEEAKKSR